MVLLCIRLLCACQQTDGSQYSFRPMEVFKAQKEQMQIDIPNPLNFDSRNSSGAGNSSSLYFPKREHTKIGIKFAHIGADAYLSWDSFGAQSLTTQGVFFVETHKNIETNIIGGLGYWCGMGAAEYVVSIDHTEIYRYTK